MSPASCSVGPLADQTQTTQQEQATLYMSPGQQHHQQQQQYPQPNHLQHLHQRTFMSPEAQVRHLLSPGKLQLFMSPTHYSGGHIVFALSVCWFAPTLTFCHNFCNIEDSNFIFGMHVYLMELHILSGERSRSSFKVKGKKNKKFKVAQKGT
ncbi:hypothetical protein DPMN_161977 [Dreissena polymorpha]|uniref:Uncharacterized protein n=1 Tax=Dreissena polymorpha TaxID=45954 RepID=A0A9D4IT75_DREPO|nr:hypothetical protein DPMN_161977 [Dreissena polymorpha]